MTSLYENLPIYMNTRLRYFEDCGVKGLDYEMLEGLRSCIQPYLGHFRWANSYRLRENLLKKKIVGDYFRLDKNRLVRKYGEPRAMLREQD